VHIINDYKSNCANKQTSYKSVWVTEHVMTT
jgi:hypothetical protein